MATNPQELIKLARERWKTDREIGNNTKLSRTTIWRMETGRFTFRPGTLAKLIGALNRA